MSRGILVVALYLARVQTLDQQTSQASKEVAIFAKTFQPCIDKISSMARRRQKRKPHLPIFFASPASFQIPVGRPQPEIFDFEKSRLIRKRGKKNGLDMKTRKSSRIRKKNRTVISPPLKRKHHSYNYGIKPWSVFQFSQAARNPFTRYDLSLALL